MGKKHDTLSKDEILHLAKLANLSISEEEIKKYSGQLTETIEYVENLDELDTSKVKPTASSANLKNIFCEDGTKNDRGFSPQDALKNAKSKNEKYFKVGRIM